MSDTPVELHLTEAVRRDMLAHLLACLPEEGCGLLGGQLDAGGVVTAHTVLPVENALHSPVRFRMDPLAQFQAFQQIEALDQELVAIFHSHPAGPDHPSPTDLEEFAYPGVLVLIFSPSVHADGWGMRAFRIENARAFPVSVTILPKPAHA